MDRLEPVLKQKFWILLGIGIILTFTGWWMATGSLKAAITTREGEIKAAEGKVPGPGVPHSDWTKQLAEINKAQDLSVNATKLALWERQRQRMFWPPGMEEFAWKNGYRKDIALSARETYRTAYAADVQRVHEAVIPFNWIEGTGIVDFNIAKLPKRVDLSAPSAEDMWNFQEDLWLLEGILQSIADLNGGPNATRQDACLHIIETLTLHGGQPAAQRKVGAPAGAGGSGMSMPGASSGETPGSFGSGGGGGNAGSVTATADFDRKEEFGDDGMGGGVPGADMGSMPSSGSSGPTGGSAAPKGRRYIEDDKALPYKTRGFYLSCVMDHRKVPNLIAALSANEKSAWPVEIVRVQVVRLHDDDLSGAGGGNFPTGGAPFGGTPFGGTGGSGAGSTDELYAGTQGTPQFGSGGDAFGGGNGSGSTFNLPNGGSGASAGNAQVAAAIQSLHAALQDPFMAKVAVAGFITLYNEVTAPPAATTNPATPATNPPTSPAAQTTTPPAAAEGNPASPETGAASSENKDSATEATVKPDSEKAAEAPQKPEGATNEAAAPKEGGGEPAKANESSDAKSPMDGSTKVP